MQYQRANSTESDSFTTRLEREGFKHDSLLLCVVSLLTLVLCLGIFILRENILATGLSAILVGSLSYGLWRGNQYLRWYKYSVGMALLIALLAQGRSIEIGQLGLSIPMVLVLGVALVNLPFMLATAIIAQTDFAKARR